MGLLRPAGAAAWANMHGCAAVAQLRAHLARCSIGTQRAVSSMPAICWWEEGYLAGGTDSHHHVHLPLAPFPCTVPPSAAPHTSGGAQDLAHIMGAASSRRPPSTRRHGPSASSGDWEV